MEKRTCELCGKLPNKIIGHHLSYDPEIIVFLCINCHKFVHIFPSLSEDQIKKVRDWSTKYSDQWRNGTEKYFRSEYRKNKNSEYDKKWYAKNKQKSSELSRKWYANNREQALEQKRKYHISNREQILKRRREWYANNREKVLERNQKWRINNSFKKDNKTFNLFPNNLIN